MADILLIDNDDRLQNSVRPVLVREGYRVDYAAPSTQAMRKMLVDRPDLVILGVDPAEQGWQFCSQLLTFLDAPLLLLLSTYDEQDRIKGLSLGADACITKPVSLGELVARVEVLLRRRKNLFVDGTLSVDLDRQEVQLDDEPLRLTPTQFQVLCCLIRHVGEVVPYERLTTQVWGSDSDGRDANHLLKSHIYRLRQKLEPDPMHPRRIVTRLREGYILHRIGE